VFLIGALIAVAPRVVFTVAMVIGAATCKAGGVFTTIEGAIIGSRGRTSSGATQGVGLEVSGDADGWATNCIVCIGLASTGTVTNTIKPAAASSFIGAIVVWVEAKLNIATKAVAESGELRSTGHAISGTAIFAADSIHTRIRGTLAIIIA
jgi:hypothetical protein